MNETWRAAKSDRQIIEKIKEDVRRKRLTVEDIVAGCEANGEPVSLSTVRRILQAGSEEVNFRTTSIVPVAHFVLSVEEDKILAAIAPQTSVDGETATLDEIREILQFRESQIAEMRIDYAERSRERTQELDFTKKALEQRGQDIVDLKKTVKRSTVAVIILSLLLFVFMAVSIGYLAWDFTHPAVGAFQWATTCIYEEAVTHDL